MKLAFSVIAATLSLNAHAALSGYYDSAKKIDVAIGNADVANSLRQQAIKSIEVDGLNVSIIAATCTRQVTLAAVAPAKGRIGAQQYVVESMTANACP